MQYVLFLLVLIMLLLNFACCLIYFWVLCVVFEWLKLQLLIITYKNMGYAVAHWWRHSTTSQKVTGLIPDSVIGIFLWQSWSHYGPEVYSASKRNEYQEYFLGSKGSQCIGLTTLPPSYANCLKIWESQPPGTLRVCPDLQWDCFT